MSFSAMERAQTSEQVPMVLKRLSSSMTLQTNKLERVRLRRLYNLG
jgi:hypothetical protein